MMSDSIWSIEDSENMWSNNIEIKMGDYPLKVQEIRSFEEIGMNEAARDKLKSLQLYNPEMIQGCTLPIFLGEYANIFLQAPNGSGQTFAALITILTKISCDGSIQCIVICPTRETATKFAELVKKIGVTCLLVKKLDPKSKGIKEQVVVGTPSKIIDLFESLKSPLVIDTLILDDIDAILSSIGYSEKVFCNKLPQAKHTIFMQKHNNKHKYDNASHKSENAQPSSSTKNMISEILKSQPVFIKFFVSLDISKSKILFSPFACYNDKYCLLKMIICCTEGQVLIVCETREEVIRLFDELAKDLKNSCITLLHKDLKEKVKEENVNLFKVGLKRVLIMTPKNDIKTQVSLVVNCYSDDTNADKYCERQSLLHNSPDSLMINIFHKRWVDFITNKKDYKLVSSEELVLLLKKYKFYTQTYN